MNLLFVCTRNIARSPMAEAICRGLSPEAGSLAVRSAGTSSVATRRLTTRDVAWADVIVAMEPDHLDHVRRLWPDHAHKVRVLDVRDHYDPDEPELRKVLTSKVQALLDELASR